MLSGGHGEVNPNSSWHSSRGAWLSYLAGVLALHLFLLSIPVLSIPAAWTLTNVIHNLVSDFAFMYIYIGNIIYHISLQEEDVETKFVRLSSLRTDVLMVR